MYLNGSEIVTKKQTKALKSFNERKNEFNTENEGIFVMDEEGDGTDLLSGGGLDILHSGERILSRSIGSEKISPTRHKFKASIKSRSNYFRRSDFAPSRKILVAAIRRREKNVFVDEIGRLYVFSQNPSGNVSVPETYDPVRGFIPRSAQSSSPGRLNRNFERQGGADSPRTSGYAPGKRDYPPAVSNARSPENEETFSSFEKNDIIYDKDDGYNCTIFNKKMPRGFGDTDIPGHAEFENLPDVGDVVGLYEYDGNPRMGPYTGRFLVEGLASIRGATTCRALLKSDGE